MCNVVIIHFVVMHLSILTVDATYSQKVYILLFLFIVTIMISHCFVGIAKKSLVLSGKFLQILPSMNVWCVQIIVNHGLLNKSLSQFRFDNKYETLVDHQKDEHDIEYSSEFLSQPVNESLAQQVILNVKSIILPMIKVQKVTVKTKIILLNMLKRPVRFKL